MYSSMGTLMVEEKEPSLSCNQSLTTAGYSASIDGTVLFPVAIWYMEPNRFAPLYPLWKKT